MKNSLFATAPVVKAKKKSPWNFKRAKERGKVNDYGGIIKRAAEGMYRLGPIVDTLEGLKKYGRHLKLAFLTMGAVKIKLD